MATTNTQTALVPGSRLTIEVTGSVAVIRTDSIFREAIVQQLTMIGLIPETVKITSGYGLIERDYKAVITLRTQAPTSTVSVIGNVSSALEKAGSYSPLITIPSIGQPGQAIDSGAIDKIVNTVGQATGTLVKTASELPDRALGSVNLIIVGIVILGAFIAFGPNIGGIAKAATRR